MIFLRTLAVAVVASAMTAFPTSANSQQVLIDGFTDPATPIHSSTPGESRAAFPPGTSGGTIVGLLLGTDIAADRGLFGPVSSLIVTNDRLNFSVAPGFVEFDWDLGGYDFRANGYETLVWRDLTNNSGQDISLRLELFQTFDGTDSVFGTGVVDIVISNGETRDVEFSTIVGETDFAGFRLANQSAVSFNGSLGSVITTVPEPTTISLIAVAFVVTTLRRRRTWR